MFQHIVPTICIGKCRESAPLRASDPNFTKAGFHLRTVIVTADIDEGFGQWAYTARSQLDN